jgi:hypothetical protein
LIASEINRELREKRPNRKKDLKDTQKVEKKKEERGRERERAREREIERDIERERTRERIEGAFNVHSDRKRGRERERVSLTTFMFIYALRCEFTLIFQNVERLDVQLISSQRRGAKNLQHELLVQII